MTVVCPNQHSFLRSYFLIFSWVLVSSENICLTIHSITKIFVKNTENYFRYLEMRLNMFFVLDIKHESSMMMYVFNLKTHLLAFVLLYITRKRKKNCDNNCNNNHTGKVSQKVACVIPECNFLEMISFSFLKS